MKRIERALISVYDKRDVVDFARKLSKWNVELLSTGGTARLLASSGLDVREVSEVTEFPEILDGRVKTLHPMVFGGLLAVRGKAAHTDELHRHGILPIDLVCVNLYPFAATRQREDATFGEIIENIDIGGPSMIRAAAKNFEDIAVVTSPEDYPALLDRLRAGSGTLPPDFLLSLARKAFIHTAHYENRIAEFFCQVRSGDGCFERSPDGAFPFHMFMNFQKVSDLRYGENPHQRAAFYRWAGDSPSGLARVRQLQGKQLSYNNIVDLDAAWNLVGEYERPACAIIKHTNPCGAAVGDSPSHAYVKAFETDPASAFGSIIAFNRAVDTDAAREVSKLFVEAVIAPRFDPQARELLAAKKNLRLLEADAKGSSVRGSHLDMKQVSGGMLVQEPDQVSGAITRCRVPTSRQPTETEWRNLSFAWTTAKHVKSNAIVLARDGRTVGIGAGQMSRVDSVRLSIEKAGPQSEGAALASDAFFPFRDGVDEAARGRVTAIVQPGGSIRDEEVIRAADEHGMAMVFTGVRHFQH